MDQTNESATATKAMNVSEATQLYLDRAKEAVANLKSPVLGSSVEIPDFDLLYDTAGKLQDLPLAIDNAWIIHALLGRAADFGNEAPEGISFPDSHHIDPKGGAEWYWFGMHLEVEDSEGNTGMLGVMSSMQKVRAVDLQTQADAGWENEDSVLGCNIVTVTVNVGDTQKIVRRNKNSQWRQLGGSIGFSSPGENFYFECGDDSLAGTENVLPLRYTVNDGDNISLQLTLDSKSNIDAENAFFLQGTPDADGHGDGMTDIPTPGIYYSWPQVQVETEGTVTVDGMEYKIIEGTGWIDHQLMMNSLENPDGAREPVPFLQDPAPYNGWSWQFFNLSNNTAWTGASFIMGVMDDYPSVPYGYYVTEEDNSWVGTYLIGANQFLEPVPLTAPVCDSTPQWKSTIEIPTLRIYELLAENGPELLTCSAEAWIDDGTFNNADYSTGAENPADFTSESEEGVTGLGFLEAISFEPQENYRERATEFLRTQVSPCD